eukprot:COSAG04_NODE_1754_length_5687_cov_2.326593_2_plen_177_part_00
MAAGFLANMFWNRFGHTRLRNRTLLGGEYLRRTRGEFLRSADGYIRCAVFCFAQKRAREATARPGFGVAGQQASPRSYEDHQAQLKCAAPHTQHHNQPVCMVVLYAGYTACLAGTRTFVLTATSANFRAINLQIIAMIFAARDPSSRLTDQNSLLLLRSQEAEADASHRDAGPGPI